MSSHREAPEISKDPVADNTDTYAFVSPDQPDTVTIITNYLPAEVPAGGPNFFEFGNDVLYSIYIDNDGDGLPDITYQFEFETRIEKPGTFLYNTGPITSLNDETWNRRQFYSIARINESSGPGHGYGSGSGRGGQGGHGGASVIATELACPPCNIGPRSTPNYSALAKEAIYNLPSGETVFAGQRNDPFFVDIGSIFDLGDLRPFQNLHLIPTASAPGVDTLSTSNVHSIAIQVPIKNLTGKGSVLGIWGAASRRKVRIADGAQSEYSEAGPWVQVSRLGNPLFNEVIVPMNLKDEWNAREPVGDKDFESYVAHPELASLLPVLYPGHFKNLEKLKGPREDLVAIFLTGLPEGVVPGFQNNTGKVLADMLRLNVSIPPSPKPNVLGLIGGDPAGYPNGRRVIDDVTTIAIRAVAGVTYPLVEKHYVPDEAAEAVTQGITQPPLASQSTFPYVGPPHSGYAFPSTTE